MTETERLRELRVTAAHIMASNWICQPFGEEPGHPSMLPETLAAALPALLAVVEAAQEVLEKHGVRPAPTIGLSADLVSLHVALKALHSQASDEGKASDG